MFRLVRKRHAMAKSFVGGPLGAEYRDRGGGRGCPGGSKTIYMGGESGAGARRDILSWSRSDYFFSWSCVGFCPPSLALACRRRLGGSQKLKIQFNLRNRRIS